jgi:hypothetical protein
MATQELKAHPLHIVWKGMKQRCYYKKDKHYKDYGGRGITICSQWLSNFDNFYYEMLSGYKKGLKLDRRDNDKGYYKENCRWVTNSQNQMNARGNLKSSSQYKGVCWNKREAKWVVNIKTGGKQKHLGYFTCEKEAALAYNSAAIRLYGVYANPNKIKEE